MKYLVNKGKNLLKNVIASDAAQETVFPILKGGAGQLLQGITDQAVGKVGTLLGQRMKKSLKRPIVIATLLDPYGGESGTGKRSKPFNKPGVFVGVMHTSDVNGDPEGMHGQVDVYSAGGRLQPGCYKNESDINLCNKY